MVSKVISITEDVYKLLKSLQLPSESFSETIRRLCSLYTAQSLHDWIKGNSGVSVISDEIWDSLEEDIELIRHRNLILRGKNNDSS